MILTSVHNPYLPRCTLEESKSAQESILPEDNTIDDGKLNDTACSLVAITINEAKKNIDEECDQLEKLYIQTQDSLEYTNTGMDKGIVL